MAAPMTTTRSRSASAISVAAITQTVSDLGYLALNPRMRTA